MAFVRSDYAHGRLKSVDVVGGAAAAGRRRGLHRRRPRRLPEARARCWCRRRRFPDLVFHGCTQLPLAQGQGPLRRRADRDGRGREPLHRRGRAARRRRRRSSRSMRSSISRAALAAGAPLVHEHLTSNARRARRAAQRATTPAREASADVVDQAAVPLRPRRVGARSRTAPWSRDWDAQGRRADHLGHHAGADSDPKRPGARCSACSSRRST